MSGLSTYPAEGNGSGCKTHKSPLAAVRVGGEREAVLQGRDDLLHLAVVIQHHQVLHHPVCVYACIQLTVRLCSVSKSEYHSTL